MLVRGFPPAYALLLVLIVALFFFWSFTSGAPHIRDLKIPLSNPLNHDSKPKSEHIDISRPNKTAASEQLASLQAPADKVQFSWKDRKEDYPIPVASYIPLPTGSPRAIPKIQAAFAPVTDEGVLKQLEDRRAAIKTVLTRGWRGYKNFAYGKDELAVISAGAREHFGGWGATLVDALDTLWMCGLKDEFEQALDVLRDVNFGYTADREVNIFETNIRFLGGLLSANDLTNGTYPILLEKAMEIGEFLYASFDTPNRMPITRWEWANARDGVAQEANTDTLLAEIGSLSLEFTRLSQVSNDTKYFDAIQRVTNELEKRQNTTKVPGLWPVTINAKYLNSMVDDTQFTLSAMADSMYEYLPKQYLLLGGRTDQTRKMYEAAIDAAKANIFYRPMTKENKDIIIAGSVEVAKDGTKVLAGEGQHLGCYTAGMLALGSKIFDRPKDLDVAIRLLDGCLWASENTPTGLMPELFHTIPCMNLVGCEWNQTTWEREVIRRHQPLDFTTENVNWKVRQHRLFPGFVAIPDRRYILRPELIESIFILYRVTGNTGYRDRAWDLWLTIEKITKTRYGNAAVGDVTTDPPEHEDFMESFWMAETLKYFWLMYAEESVLDLDKWVFSTEAHPFKRSV